MRPVLCGTEIYRKAFLFIATDEELFEDNPEEYIRRDIEGSGEKHY